MSQRQEKWQREREELRHQESMTQSRKQTRYAMYALFLSIAATCIGLFTLLGDDGSSREPVGEGEVSDETQDQAVLTYAISTESSYRPFPEEEDDGASSQSLIVTSPGDAEEEPIDALFSPLSSPHLVVEARLTGPAPPEGSTIWVFLSPDQGVNWWIKEAEPDGPGQFIVRFRRSPSIVVDDDNLLASVSIGEPAEFTPSTDYRPPQSTTGLETQSAGSSEQDEFFDYSGDSLEPVPVDFTDLPISATATISIEPLEE